MALPLSLSLSYLRGDFDDRAIFFGTDLKADPALETFCLIDDLDILFIRFDRLGGTLKNTMLATPLTFFINNRIGNEIAANQS